MAMACFARLVLCASLVVFASASQSPVTKVVELIEELKVKIEEDGKREEMIYNKFACWCENTAKEKAANIHKAFDDIKELGSKILELKGLIATRTSEIAVDSLEIRKNQAAQNEATGIRQSANKEYLAEKAEFETTLSSLESAIKTLGAAPGPQDALLQADSEGLDEMTLLNIAANVHAAIDKLPSASALPPKDLALISAFTKDPAEFYDQKERQKSARNPAGSAIMGILKDMYDTFSMNLEKGTEVEAVSNKNFESTMGVKENEMADLVKAKKKRDLEKADAEKDMADASQMLDDTTVQMKEDTELFDLLKPACKAKAAEWQERVRARTEELLGIKKALEILTSDDAKALFNKAIKPGMETFLQTSDDNENGPKARAYKVLKNLATKTQSLNLAEVAATLRLGGHFDSVIAEIEKMMATLKEEEKADIEQRDWCKEETFKNEQEASRYEYKIQRFDAHLAKLGASLEELQSTLADTVNQIITTKTEIENMENTRQEEHSAFTTSKSDDEGAVKLLGMAIESMSSFKKNNDALLQQTPEEILAKAGMPTTEYSAADKNKNESGGIITIMTMIKEDLQAEIKTAIKEEEESQADYMKELAAAQKLEEELKKKKTNVETSIAEKQKEIDEAEGFKGDTQDLLKEEHDYLKSIKPDCDWILKAFDERRTKRAMELDGLMNAKGLLSGAQPTVNMVETAQAFDDNELPRMTFRGSR